MMESFPQLSGTAGAAFLLDHPARIAAILEHPDGTVTLRCGAPYATVALKGSYGIDSARTDSWNVLQESLDALAARSRIALQTSQGDGTYLLWDRCGTEYHLVCVDTADVPWSTHARATTGSSALHQIELQMERHAAFRFYRLSQISSDLFDAYRNAYLALECLVSDSVPKLSGEKELVWLKRALNGPLADGVPGGLSVEQTVEAIYLQGRNPIFHAKSGSTFYSPHGPERQAMQELFATLTLLLVCLLQHRFGVNAARRWASMSQAVHDAQARASFTFDSIVLRNEEQQLLFAASPQTVESPRRFGQFWCQASVQGPFDLVSLTRVETQKDGLDWTSATLNEVVPLTRVCQVSIELNLLQYNSRAPKPMHWR